MKITAYQIEDNPLPIIPGRKKRKWMDETADKYAYRCLPLTIANQTGWELLAPTDFTISWNGGVFKEDLQFNYSDSLDWNFCSSSFGYGILTIHTGYLFRTSDDTDLLVSGAPNFYTDYMSPLSGIVETHWLNFTFTMNWKLYHPGTFTFYKDDPLAFLLPISHSYEIKTEKKHISENIALEIKYTEWATDRQKIINDIDAMSKGEPTQIIDPNKPTTHWEKNYYTGTTKDNKKIKTHISSRHFPKF